MIRLSGSVKLRCAFGSGTACSGSGTCGLRPLTFLPVRASCSRRCLIWASAAAFFSSAFCWASASNSAFAARIVTSRLSRRANSAGNSSPPCPFPCFSSSARIHRVGSLQDLFHFCLQPLLRFPHPLIAHRLVLARIARDLAAIDRHVSQLHQPRFLTQLQSLAKQPRQCLQMPLAKFRQRTMVGMFLDRQVSKRYILVGLRLDLARTVAPCAVAVQ